MKSPKRSSRAPFSETNKVCAETDRAEGQGLRIMTNILIITKRFYPPWSDGIVSYARGLVDSIELLRDRREDLKLSVVSLTDEWFPKLYSADLAKYLETKLVDLKWYHSNQNSRCLQVDILRLVRKLSREANYHVVHVTYEGLDPLLTRGTIQLEHTGLVLKHVLIYPMQRTFPIQRTSYRFMEMLGSSKLLRVKFSVSSDVLKEIYGFRDPLVLPPAVDAQLYRPAEASIDDAEKHVDALRKAQIKFGDLESVLSREVLVLGMGPLTPERFPYESILGSMFKLRKERNIDLGLLAIGRGFENPGYIREIMEFARRKNMSRRVFLCLKALSDENKNYFLNRATIFLNLFQKRLIHSAVFPPIALLECMFAGNAVVLVGGPSCLRVQVQNQKNGIFIENVFDDKEIADGIVNAIQNRKEIASNARLYANNEYSTEKLADRYLTFLDSMGL